MQFIFEGIIKEDGKYFGIEFRDMDEFAPILRNLRKLIDTTISSMEENDIDREYLMSQIRLMEIRIRHIKKLLG